MSVHILVKGTDTIPFGPIDGETIVDTILMYERHSRKVTDGCIFAYSPSQDAYFQLPDVKLTFPATIRGFRGINYTQIELYENEREVAVPAKFARAWEDFREKEYSYIQLK